MGAEHPFKRVESNPELVDEVASKELASEPAGQPQAMTGNAKEAAEAMITSSVRSTNLTFNIESSTSEGEGADKAKSAGGKTAGKERKGFSVMGLIHSCCFVSDSKVDSFASSSAYGQRGGTGPGSQLPRVFSRLPGTPGARDKGPGFDRKYNGNRTYMLPPQSGDTLGKKTLVLDLDETLVHSSFDYLPDADLVLPVEVQGITQEVYVRKRPGLDEFLEFVGKHYEVGVFTASVIKYADAVLDRIDKTQVRHPHSLTTPSLPTSLPNLSPPHIQKKSAKTDSCNFSLSLTRVCWRRWSSGGSFGRAAARPAKGSTSRTWVAWVGGWRARSSSTTPLTRTSSIRRTPLESSPLLTTRGTTTS